MYRGHFTSHPLSTPEQVVKFLRQGRYWVDAQLSRVSIENMETDYVLSVMLWLVKRSPSVKLAMELHYEVKGANAEKLETFRQISPYDFIRDTPIFKALHSRYIESMQDPFDLELELDTHDDDDLPY